MKITKFSEFLRESETPGMVCSTFTFQDGMIPISATERVEFEEAESRLPANATIDYSGIGPMVTIEHTGTDSEAYCIHNTGDFMESEETAEIFKKYLSFLGEIV